MLLALLALQGLRTVEITRANVEDLYTGEPVVLRVRGKTRDRMLPLRADLATRLAAGLVYQLHGLDDEEKSAALHRHAAARGLRLAPEVTAYLLRHARRDMPSLLALLDALDRYSLETQRAITVPLLRELLALTPDPSPGGRGELDASCSLREKE